MSSNCQPCCTSFPCRLLWQKIYLYSYRIGKTTGFWHQLYGLPRHQWI